MVAIAVAVAVVVVGLVAAQQGWLRGNRSTTASPSRAASSGEPADSPAGASPSAGSAAATSTSTTGPTAGSESTPSGGTSSSSAEPSPSSDPAGSAAKSALTSCRYKVRAADEVLDAARVGIRHWGDHVQAQTDADAGKISLAKMDAIFKRTRLDGPDDVSAYNAAQKKADAHSGSCRAPDGASAAVQDQLDTCSTRSKAQQPVLKAADDAMDDWTSHLAAMRRSRMGHVHDAQGVWIRAWRAAPPHIAAFHEAQSGFDAPAC